MNHIIKALDDASLFVARSVVQNDLRSHHNDHVRLLLHLSSTSPFFVLYKKNEFSTVPRCCLNVTSKRSKDLGTAHKNVDVDGTCKRVLIRGAEIIIIHG